MGGQYTERAKWEKIVNDQISRKLVKKEAKHYKIAIFFVSIDEFDVISSEITGPEPLILGNSSNISSSSSIIPPKIEKTKLDNSLEVFGEVNIGNGKLIIVLVIEEQNW